MIYTGPTTWQTKSALELIALSTLSTGLFSASFLLFSELDLLLLLLLLEDEELEEDFESCLFRLSFERDPLASVSCRYGTNKPSP